MILVTSLCSSRMTPICQTSAYRNGEVTRSSSDNRNSTAATLLVAGHLNPPLNTTSTQHSTAFSDMRFLQETRMAQAYFPFAHADSYVDQDTTKPNTSTRHGTNTNFTNNNILCVWPRLTPKKAIVSWNQMQGEVIHACARN